jgi:amino acid adenylation domain-containing protein
MNTFSKGRPTLPPKRRELLAKLLKRDGNNLATTTIVSLPRESAEIPLSFSQQRLWFLDQLEPGSHAYHIPVQLRLKGSLNLPALEKTFGEIVRRHEILRTSFPSLDGRPMQFIMPALPVRLPLVDLRGMEEPEREERMREIALEEIQRPFNLVTGPLLRLMLLQAGDEDQVLLINMHHIVSDGWSLGVFLQEVSVLYEAYSGGQPAMLPEMAFQYADFAHWQREALQGPVMETELAYWKEQLRDRQPVLLLPLARPRTAKQNFRVGQEPFMLDQELSEALKRLARQEGVTQFMLLLAAFKTLLYRYTQQGDISVGTSIAGRNQSELGGMIGCFLNTLVMKTSFTGDVPFKELLKRVRGVALGAFAHQRMPFEKLVEVLQPERDLGHHPLFQVMFDFISTPPLALQLRGLEVSNFEVAAPAAKFELSLSMADRETGLAGLLEYNMDLYDEATIKGMLRHFQNLLEALTDNPSRRISDLKMLDSAESHQLLKGWNDTGTDDETETCLQDLFERQALRTPDAIAIVFEDEQVTYRELHDRANQLAHYLRRLGVGPDVLVGVCVERSVEMLVALLGILKAGGAYVPLDPTYPKERLAYMLEDANVSVLLTQERLSDHLPMHPARVLRLDADWQEIAEESCENPLNRSVAESLAYVIYTSGSTGKPKGVQISHRAVVNFLRSMSREPGLSQDDVMLALTTLSFDIAALELFLPISVGARVVLLSRETAADALQLARKVNEVRPTVMQATATTWRLLLDTDWPGDSQLKGLCGGEALSAQLAQQLLERCGSLWNLYGPTESTVWSLAKQMDPNGRAVLIGRPIANTSVYLLDSHLQPLPAGVCGELFIGGAGLSRGYLNRPELTAEKFLPNPFAEEHGARLYRTGDVARYHENGEIEFLGRVDEQVKVRGYRIEPGEIEALLRRHPSIRESLVIARNDEGYGQRLVGYLVAQPDSTLSVSELREHLKQELPEYMIPSNWVFLESLPLTPNGKLNRQALPAPDGARPDIISNFTAPRTPVEEKLSDIWCETLVLERAGIHDNFFELGGHSLLATQIISRVRASFQVELPLRSLFESPTIAELAVIILQLKAARQDEDEMASLLSQVENMSASEIESYMQMWANQQAA